jgi:hypothetical protein
MKPNPSVADLNWYARNYEIWNIDVDSAMTGALRLNMTFNISILDETRIIPGTIYLGHDSAYLYVGGIFHGMYRNPTSNDPDGAFADVLVMLFDANNDGKLTFPEAGSCIGVYIWENNQYVWNHIDLVWEIPTYPYWDQGAAYYQPKAQPAFGVDKLAPCYDNSTGTVSVVFARYLWQPGNAEINALQMRPGERWVMGFMLLAGYSDRTKLFPSFVKSWPDGFSYQSSDSSWWPKLVIDLSNPPLSFSNNPQSSPIYQYMIASSARSIRRNDLLP